MAVIKKDNCSLLSVYHLPRLKKKKKKMKRKEKRKEKTGGCRSQNILPWFTEIKVEFSFMKYHQCSPNELK